MVWWDGVTETQRDLHADAGADQRMHVRTRVLSLLHSHQQLVNRHCSSCHNATPSETECLRDACVPPASPPSSAGSETCSRSQESPSRTCLPPPPPSPPPRSVPGEALTAGCTDAGLKRNIVPYLCRISQVIMKLWGLHLRRHRSRSHFQLTVAQHSHLYHTWGQRSAFHVSVWGYRQLFTVDQSW